MTVDATSGLTERAIDFAPIMSAAEALMWKISDDPWLRPVAGGLAVLDQAPDVDLLRRRVRQTVVDVPRLRERVTPGPAPWDAPRWVPDADFDLDYHLRHVGLAGAGSMRELYDVVSRWYEDPFDPNRPLWQFVIVDGVEGGRGALFSKMHHAISDGIGLLRLSERYIDLERHTPPPPEVDLDEAVRRAAEKASGAGGLHLDTNTLETVMQISRQVGRVAATPISVALRSAAETAGVIGNPNRTRQTAEGLVSTLRTAVGEFSANGTAGSPLWTARSGRRHLESVRVPLDEVKRAGAVLGGSVNDVFVTGAVNAVVDYHRGHDAPLDTLTFSFVVSQRRSAGAGGNFFTPVRVHLPVPPAPVTERLIAVRDAMAGRRASAQSGSLSLNSMANVAQLLPASFVRQFARAQAAGVDFATSNLRGAPVPLYIAGARVLHNTALGPLTGTPFNLTTISYDGSLDMGLLVDPVAVADPDDLRECLEGAFRDLIRAAR